MYYNRKPSNSNTIGNNYNLGKKYKNVFINCKQLL